MALKVTHEDFVVAWVTSSSLEELTSTTGMTRPAATQRALMLRRAGVNLPKYKRNVLDAFRVAQLNSLINKHKRN